MSVIDQVTCPSCSRVTGAVNGRCDWCNRRLVDERHDDLPVDDRPVDELDDEPDDDIATADAAPTTPSKLEHRPPIAAVPSLAPSAPAASVEPTRPDIEPVEPESPPLKESGKAGELRRAREEIEARRDEGWKLITMFGPSEAGKTEYMRALFRKLDRQGSRTVQLEEMLERNIAGTTRGSNPGRYPFPVKHDRWVLVDVGGEFFDDLFEPRREPTYLVEQYRFLETLAGSRGFLYFVHLGDQHFEVPGRHHDDPARARDVKSAQRELSLLRHVLWFSRAVANGHRWDAAWPSRSGPWHRDPTLLPPADALEPLLASLELRTLEATLQNELSQRRIGALDAALGVVFTKADVYADPDGDVTVRRGVTLSPRSNPTPPTLMVRDHLRSLFEMLSSGVRSWKADYTRAAIGTRAPDDEGRLTIDRLIPDDPESREDLSVGVVSIFDFVLQFARDRRIPTLSTGQALLLRSWLQRLRRVR